MSARAAPDHVVLNTVVFDDIRVAYVPVPKAATTSILGAFFDLAGGRSDDRVRSHKPEATRDQTVHDGSLWGPTFRLKERRPDEREWILESDAWFRFTVVREPVRRIWSAWVSKVLVRDPRFVLMFGQEWFPDVPRSATDVLHSFRAFVSALPERPDWEDSHWQSQSSLVGIPGMKFDHVGRLESLARTEAEVRSVISGRGGELPGFDNENASLLPFSPGILDRQAHDASLRLTSRDRAAFGYDPVEYTGGEPDEQWFAAVDSSIPAIRALVERHERLLDLWRLANVPPEPPRRRRVAVAGGVAALASAGTVLAASRVKHHEHRSRRTVRAFIGRIASTIL